MSEASALVRLEKAAASYGGRAVFSGVDAVFSRGLVHAVFGPTACGKSTLLNLLAGLVKPSSGRILYEKEEDKRRVALIPQDYGLFPWKTVQSNVMMGLEIRSRYRLKPDGRAKAARLMRELGIAELAKRWPATLSGGQKQRTAIARALAVEPSLLLMDEPFNALDAYIRDELQAVVRRLPLLYGATVVIVTHDIAEALSVSDRILVFVKNDIAENMYRIQEMENDRGRRVELDAALRAVLRDARREGKSDGA